jgi:hypothetical protein
MLNELCFILETDHQCMYSTVLVMWPTIIEQSQWQLYVLFTGAALYALSSVLLISNKF